MKFQKLIALVTFVAGLLGGASAYSAESGSFDSRVAAAKKGLKKFPTGRQALKELQSFYPGGIEIQSVDNLGNPDSGGTLAITDSGKLVIQLKSTESVMEIEQDIPHELVHLKDIYPLVSGPDKENFKNLLAGKMAKVRPCLLKNSYEYCTETLGEQIIWLTLLQLFHTEYKAHLVNIHLKQEGFVTDRLRVIKNGVEQDLTEEELPEYLNHVYLAKAFNVTLAPAALQKLNEVSKKYQTLTDIYRAMYPDLFSNTAATRLQSQSVR